MRHHDCAEKPLDKKIQTERIITALKAARSRDFDVKVIGLWVNENVEHAIYAGNWAML